MRSKLMAALIGAAALSVLGGGYAVAGPLITGKNVKNSSLTGRDIKNGSLSTGDIKRGDVRFNRLSKGTQDLIREGGTSGQNGASGAPGQNGTNGTNGTVGGAGGNFNPRWGIIHRNTIGSPDISLASGPFVGAATNQQPPFGSGSLSFLVKDGTEKPSFGNQVDFAGDALSDLDQVGFRVFQTGENTAAGKGGTNNLPSISIEVDPDGAGGGFDPPGDPVGTTNFSTLVFVPDPVPTNVWSPYLDGTSSGKWGFTGTQFNSPATSANCGLNGPRCSLSEAKAVAPDATIGSVAVSKGRDNEWQGSIDGLRVNNQVFDFEVGGVQTRAAP